MSDIISSVTETKITLQMLYSILRKYNENLSKAGDL